MNPAIEFYEFVVDKTVILADGFYGSDTYKHYSHSDSLHSFTTAFGVPQPRLCCFCDKIIGAEFSLSSVINTSQKKGRYLLKLTAMWQDWKQYVHPAKITLNSNDILNGQLFLENVCKGWPGIYFGVPPEYLDKKNILEITNKSGGKNTLLVERIELLRLKEAEDFTIQYCPDFVSSETNFAVKLCLLKNHKNIKVKYHKDILEFIKRTGSDFIFMAKRVSQNIKITFESEKSKCTAVINDIYQPQNGREVFVGMDCDDYRQDSTEELDRILEHFTYTQMGNFIAFRPKPQRNYPAKYPAKLGDWKRWILFCKRNNINFQFSGIPEVHGHNPLNVSQELVEFGKNNFAGFQIHEPYCVSFSPVLKNPTAIKKAKNFADKKNEYLKFVNSQVDAIRYKDARVFCGDPSLLSVYLRESKVDNILCEPVSNSSILFGAARGTGKDFGAHLAPDWYGGFPHDHRAIDRLSLLLDLIYAYGGKHIYIESTAFKTNSFSRNDWEDEFCRLARQKLRDFYRFTCKDSRTGNPTVDMAFVYGNLESMFWRPYDRIPELADSGNWDDVVWGKWPDTQYRRLWKATDAWLPPLDFEAFGKNESLTKMFCGSPFGQIDLVLPDSDLSCYKAIAFLGWNTMNEQIYQNLLSYVNNGGTLFICGCHFDTRISFKGNPRFIRNGDISELIGADIAGPGRKIFNNFRICELKNITAQQKQDFLFEHKVGKGKVYFFNFYDYPYDQRLVRDIQTILENIGKNLHKESSIRIEGANSKFINYTIWDNGTNKKMYLINIDWQNKREKKVIVRNGNKCIPVVIPDGKILAINL